MWRRLCCRRLAVNDALQEAVPKGGKTTFCGQLFLLNALSSLFPFQHLWHTIVKEEGQYDG